MIRKLSFLLCLMLVVLFAPVLLFAQTVPNSEIPPDWFSLGGQAIMVLLPIAAGILAYYFDLWIGLISDAPLPRMLVTLLVPSLGAFSVWLQTFVMGHTFNPTIAALLSFATLIVHTLIDKFQNHGFSTAPTANIRTKINEARDR